MAPTIRPRAAFLGAPGRRLFTLGFQPEGPARGQVLYVPPFAEELNRCRALVSAQARQFAAAGYGCTLLDLWGTGDSDGELVDVGLTTWRDNIAAAVADVRRQYGVSPLLWGIRTGALLAWEYARGGEESLSGLLLLQPVSSGKRFVRQLVRQRVAAGVGRADAAETSDQVRAIWKEGGAVEIGGYLPSGALMLALEELDMSTGPVPALPVTWLEHVTAAGREPGPATIAVIDGLRESGCEVSLHCFGGPPVWQLNERDETPELLQLMQGLYSI